MQIYFQCEKNACAVLRNLSNNLEYNNCIVLQGGKGSQKLRAASLRRACSCDTACLKQAKQMRSRGENFVFVLYLCTQFSLQHVCAASQSRSEDFLSRAVLQEEGRAR